MFKTIFGIFTKLKNIIDHLKDSGSYLFQIFGTRDPQHHSAPSFGSSLDLQNTISSPTRLDIINRILCIIGDIHPELGYTPLIPPIVAILAKNLSDRPDDMLACMISMIDGHALPAGKQRQWAYFPLHRRDYLVFERVFEDLVTSFCPKVAKHIILVQLKDPTYAPKWELVLSGLFIGILPRELVLRIFDCYLTEGFKIILRFAVAHIIIRQKVILSARNGVQIDQAILKPTYAIDSLPLNSTSHHSSDDGAKKLAGHFDSVSGASDINITALNRHEVVESIGDALFGTQLFQNDPSKIKPPDSSDPAQNFVMISKEDLFTNTLNHDISKKASKVSPKFQNIACRSNSVDTIRIESHHGKNFDINDESLLKQTLDDQNFETFDESHFKHGFAQIKHLNSVTRSSDGSPAHYLPPTMDLEDAIDSKDNLDPPNTSDPNQILSKEDFDLIKKKSQATADNEIRTLKYKIQKDSKRKPLEISKTTNALIKLYFDTAKGVRFDRSQIERYRNRRRKHSMGDFDQEDRLLIFQRPMPTIRKPSSFMSVRDWTALWQWIPPRYRLLDVDLIFTLESDGRHLLNLFQNCAGVEPVILLVETASGGVVGGYLSRAIGLEHGQSFYGTGETFIFGLRPGEPRRYLWNPISSSDKPDVPYESNCSLSASYVLNSGVDTSSSSTNLTLDYSKLETSNQNISKNIDHSISCHGADKKSKSSVAPPSFICVTDSFVALGAGGDFGLWFDRTLTKVASGRCETFGNDPLLSQNLNERGGSEELIYSMEVFRFC